MGDQAIVSRLVDLKASLGARLKSIIMDDEPPGSRIKKFTDIPSMAAMTALTERHSLSALLPYETYDEETRLYYNRDTIGFMMICSPATSLTAQDLKILNNIYRDYHPTNACIQISMLTDSNVEPLINAWKEAKLHTTDEETRRIFSVMSENRAAYLTSGKWKSFYPDQPFVVKNFHLVLSYTIEAGNDEATNQEGVETLLRRREAFKGILRSVQIYSEDMDPDLFLNVFHPILNPKRGANAPLYWDGEGLISEQLIDADTAYITGSGASTLIHEGEKFSVIPFHVKQFPKKWPGFRNGGLIGSFLQRNLNIDCQFIATLTVRIPDQTSEKSKAKQKSMRATQMVTSPISKYVPAWKEREQDWTYTQAKMDEGDKLFQSFYQVILITPQANERQCTQNFKALYDSLGWITTRSRYTPVHSLLGALPMGLCKESHRAMKVFRMYSPRLSWTCTNIAPWIAEWKGTRTPLMMFMGRRGQLVFFNHFDNKAGNFNIACPATSGAGKSFVTQELVFSVLGRGGIVFIIDAGHSYRNICKLLKGTYIDFGEGRPIFNPFTKIFSKQNLDRVRELAANDSAYSIKDYFDDFMPMLKQLLGQMASPLQPLDPQQSSCLEMALFAALDRYSGDTTITRVAEMLGEQRDENGQLLDHAKDVALALFPYTKDGMFGRYFEGENNIDLDKSLVVLDLDALNAKGDLQSVVLLILMMQINQIMYLKGNKSQLKQVVIDEAWRLLQNGRAGGFIEEGYRVARKHGGSYMTIVQKISDYYRSDVAKAAFMNSDFVFYLRQKPEELSAAEQSGYISNADNKIEVLRSLRTEQGRYSEIAISSPDGLAAVRFVTDKVGEKIYSTTAAETDFIRDAVKRGVDLFTAAQQLIERQAK